MTAALLTGLRKGGAFVHRDYLTEASYRFSFLMQLVQVILTSLVAYFMAEFLRQRGVEVVTPFARDYFSFVILGWALLDYQVTAHSVFSRSLYEGQVTGTLETLLVTQTSLEMTVLGSSLYAFVYTTVRLAAYLLFGVLLFGMSVASAYWGAVLVLLALSVAAFSAFGVLSACFILLFKKGDPVSWVLLGASGVLGGVFYPVSALPLWLASVAQLLPITHALEGVRRALLAGEGLGELWREALILLLFAGVGLPLALAVFRWSVRRAKMTGTLAQY
jgi:ABC-2 type transport system permease protein